MKKVFNLLNLVMGGIGVLIYLFNDPQSSAQKSGLSLVLFSIILLLYRIADNGTEEVEDPEDEGGKA